MEKFSSQLREKGFALTEFDKELDHYKEALRKLQAERGTAREFLIQKIPDITNSALKDIPVIGETLKQEAKSVADYFLSEHRFRQILRDAERLEDSIGTLTMLFVEELNALTSDLASFASYWAKRRRKIILFFDSFEQLASQAAPWLIDYFLESRISSHIVLVIAGRDPIERSVPEDPKRWLPYLDDNTVFSISLDSFSKDETHLYLAERATFSG